MVREIVEVAYLKWRGPKKDRAYWEPTAEMRAAGMANTRLKGTKVQIHSQAEALNLQWEQIKKGIAASAAAEPLADSIAWWCRKYAGVYDKKTKTETFRSSRKFRKLAPRTQRDYRYYLVEFFIPKFGVYPVRSIVAKVLKTYYEATCDNRGDYFGYHMLIAIRALFKWLTSESAIDMNPAASVEIEMPDSRQTRWMPEQTDLFCATALKKNRRSMALAVRIADWIAQRPFDTRMLRWPNYDGSRLVGIRQSKRKTPVPPIPLTSDLIAMIDATPKISVYIIVSEGTKRPYTEVNFERVFAEIRDEAGLPKELQFRDFRRTAITESYDAGATDEEARSFSAHANPSSMKPYRVLTDVQGGNLKDKRLLLRAKRSNQGAETG